MIHFNNATKEQIELYNDIGSELRGSTEDIIVVLKQLLYEMETEGNIYCR
jgi:hypothetical protein